jgi:colanic acid/amylovoran biosynthesis glycosyltransferase
MHCDRLSGLPGTHHAGRVPSSCWEGAILGTGIEQTRDTGGRGAGVKPRRVMNVLLVVPWDQASGGVASVVGNLARHLQESGHSVVFLHPGPTEHLRERATASGFNGYEIVLRAPLIESNALKSLAGFAVHVVPTLYRLASLIRKRGIQVVNIHYPTEALIYFGILRWLLPIRLVVSVHGADLFPEGRTMKRYPLWLRFILRCSDAVVAPSKAFLADSVSVLPHSAAKGHAIHNGVDASAFHPSATVLPARPYVLCIAAHNEKKALDVLLEAFARTRRTHPGVNLVLVGDGPLRHQLEARAASLGLGADVEFAGEKGRQEIVRLLRDCTFLVLPSRAEPFGMVVTEAMASRKAVVATRVGGIREIIENGESGILVEPDDPAALADAMATLLRDPRLRDMLAEAGFRRVLEHFGFRRMGERYVELFSSLLTKSPTLPGQTTAAR